MQVVDQGPRPGSQGRLTANGWCKVCTQGLSCGVAKPGAIVPACNNQTTRSRLSCLDNCWQQRTYGSLWPHIVACVQRNLKSLQHPRDSLCSAVTRKHTGDCKQACQARGGGVHDERPTSDNQRSMQQQHQQSTLRQLGTQLIFGLL